MTGKPASFSPAGDYCPPGGVMGGDADINTYVGFEPLVRIEVVEDQKSGIRWIKTARSSIEAFSDIVLRWKYLFALTGTLNDLPSLFTFYIYPPG